MGLTMQKNPRIRLTLIRSKIGKKPNQRATLKALGLGKLNSEVEVDSSAAIRGMMRTVSHLLKVEEDV